ncbi:AzlD family protein [Cohaesibacter celericrescens]|uniref:Branched-chain amino acid transport n=1 Tax=Cohaesibacter celericrescens TaxID=2067669 RepID=A0A2N5XQF4_9HYPH|nr:AzlD family protein [Cohaesibacter celericrescens]PLW76742.1 branched-chain amino acid transport [Cohaesibacter celericrescens]
MSSTLWIILGGALVTYLTRFGGHVVLSRFKHIHPRVQAGLDAVPAAVLTTLMAPAVVSGGPAEWAAMAVATAAGLRLSILPMVAVGMLTLVVLRHSLG